MATERNSANILRIESFGLQVEPPSHLSAHTLPQKSQLCCIQGGMFAPLKKTYRVILGAHPGDLKQGA